MVDTDKAERARKARRARIAAVQKQQELEQALEATKQELEQALEAAKQAANDALKAEAAEGDQPEPNNGTTGNDPESEMESNNPFVAVADAVGGASNPFAAAADAVGGVDVAGGNPFATAILSGAGDGLDDDDSSAFEPAIFTPSSRPLSCLGPTFAPPPTPPTAQQENELDGADADVHAAVGDAGPKSPCLVLQPKPVPTARPRSPRPKPRTPRQPRKTQNEEPTEGTAESAEVAAPTVTVVDTTAEPTLITAATEDATGILDSGGAGYAPATLS